MSRASPPTHLTVVGAGAWGTVLAMLLARNGHAVSLWTRNPQLADSINRTHENGARLPGVRLPTGIRASADLAESLTDSRAAFVAVPSTALPSVARELAGVSDLVSCSKGLALPGLRRLSEVLGDRCPNARTAVLSGPNLAGEIAQGMPAAAVAASDWPDLAENVQLWLQSNSFRVYTSPDPIGAEVGGALKNVIALAAGMSDGLELGDNAKASIVTRGLVELVKVCGELGGRRETIYGLAGVGDLMATCSSRRSRNHMAGERIASGADVEALKREGITAEGIPTVRAVHRFAQDQNLDLPIATEVYRVIFEKKDPRQALDDLMGRARRAEW